MTAAMGATLSPSEFQRLASLIESKVGIHFAPAKRDMLAARLSKRMRALGVQDTQDYLALAQDEAEQRKMLDQVTTNQTYFWREPEHFGHLMAWVKERSLQDKPGRLRLWSAACSSGEEAYTMALCAMEASEGRCEVKVLASDLSDRMLEKAVEARYDDAKIKLLPGGWKQRWFRKGPDGRWSPAPELRAAVSFARLNLMELPSAPTGFDAIFCRNVMIYFDRPVQTNVVASLSARLKPQGFLYTGMAESLLAIPHGLLNRAPSVYQRPA
jgi:chemotaxis protein methyltransferase CheR